MTSVLKFVRGVGEFLIDRFDGFHSCYIFSDGDVRSASWRRRRDLGMQSNRVD